MHRFVFILILVIECFGFYESKSQNLITNGSFESYTSPIDCLGGSNYNAVNNWLDFNSADYFNPACILNYGTPFNFFGNTYPKNGLSYSGFALIEGNNYTSTLKEYIFQQLKAPLKKNYVYCMSYYVSRSDYVTYAIQNIDAWFSNSPPTLNLSFYIDTLPQIKNYTGIITDTANWTLVADTFIAKGGEQYVTIGNFNNFTNTIKSAPGTLNPSILDKFAYYYIDSVSLTVCDSIPLPPKDTSFNVLEPTLPNVFTPNGDGVNDVFKFELKQATLNHFNVYDRWGLEIKNEKLKINDEVRWDGKSIQGDACPAGVYFYVLEYEDSKHLKHKKRGYITLIK